MKPVNLIIVGAGDRGKTYAEFALEHPDKAKIVGVAEPRQVRRDRLAKDHSIPPENQFDDWRQVIERGKFADAAVIATLDTMHADPAVAMANLGYHILLEKPMSPDPSDCKKIVEAALAKNILFAVCHVLRYTTYTKQLKEILDQGLIGEIVSIQHLEPVGFWHYAHSFVRGNWRNQTLSSPMLLQKSCHDLDWIRYIVGKPCIKVSSFGNLNHFITTNKPSAAGNALRCLECDHEPQCSYSAKKIYLDRLEPGYTGWPVRVLTPNPTVENIKEALSTGPYGRCVYECDNDVVDHQVVNMEFVGGISAAFTMTAFTEMPLGGRKTRIFGTLGELYSDGLEIELFDFLTKTLLQ